MLDWHERGPAGPRDERGRGSAGAGPRRFWAKVYWRMWLKNQRPPRKKTPLGSQTAMKGGSTPE